MRGQRSGDIELALTNSYSSGKSHDQSAIPTRRSAMGSAAEYVRLDGAGMLGGTHCEGMRLSMLVVGVGEAVKQKGRNSESRWECFAYARRRPALGCTPAPVRERNDGTGVLTRAAIPTHSPTMSSTRRGVGLSAFSRSTITNAQYASHGSALRTSHAASLQAQLSVFQSLLHNFSITHARDIRSNPTFRAEFARMCAAIGVDPLASSNVHKSGGKEGGAGSWWAQMLGGSVNDFYFELAVRVVEVCRDTRSENGGMVSVAEVRERVQRGKVIGGGMEVSEYVDALISTPGRAVTTALTCR